MGDFGRVSENKVKVKVAPDSLRPHIVHGIFPHLLVWVAVPFSRDFPSTGSPTLQADSVPAEPQGKPKNTGVDSLSLLRGSSPPGN